MKKRELFNLLTVFNEMGTTKADIKFAYLRAKNKKLLEQEVETIREALKGFNSPNKFNEYEEKRMDLCRKMAEKDDEGKPIINNGAYVIVDMDGFEKKLSTLKNKYHDAIEENERVRKEMESFLDEDSSVDLIKMPLSCFPKELENNYMEYLFDIILEDEKKCPLCGGNLDDESTD